MLTALEGLKAFIDNRLRAATLTAMSARLEMWERPQSIRFVFLVDGAVITMFMRANAIYGTNTQFVATVVRPNEYAGIITHIAVCVIFGRSRQVANSSRTHPQAVDPRIDLSGVRLNIRVRDLVSF